jgi:hypothetical protein
VHCSFANVDMAKASRRLPAYRRGSYSIKSVACGIFVRQSGTEIYIFFPYFSNSDSDAGVIPSVLHTRLQLHIAVTRTNGQSR